MATLKMYFTSLTIPQFVAKNAGIWFKRGREDLNGKELICPNTVEVKYEDSGCPFPVQHLTPIHRGAEFKTVQLCFLQV